jgi:gliding motility-associated-like protein
MKRTIIPWLSFLCLPFLAFTQDLNCGLDSRWELQPNAGIQTFTIEVGGYLNDQLSNSGQGLCGVEIGFLHSAIRDLEIWLESPAGQRIQLIGPNDAGSRAGLGANWQVTFVPSTETAEPMPGGYAAQWDNNQTAELTVTGFGTYYPFDNNFRLEDFNLGSVNGTWTVEVRTDPTSAYFSPVGYIYNFRLVFCDESGTSCCFAEAGNLAGDGVSACQGDPSLDIAPPEVRYVFSIRPDELLYSYSYLVAQGEDLLEQTDDPDFTAYPPGEYQVYGLSYRITDEIIVQALDLNVWTLTSLRNDLASDLPLFCGDITTDFFHVQIISPEAVIASPQTLFCARPEVTLDGRGSTPGSALTYEWLDESGNTLGRNSLQTVDTPGVYRLVVSLTGSDCRDTATVEVLADFNDPVADAGASPVLTCDQPEQLIGGPATSSGAALIYQWNTADGYIVSRSDTVRPLVNAAGTYVLEVIDTLNGCSATDSVVVTEDFAPPAADAGTSGTLTCADTEWILGGTGTSSGPDFTYAWTTPDGNFTTPVDILQPLADAPGTYILEVTNTRNGCVATDTVQLTENTTPPSADAGPPATLTCEVPEVTLGGPGTDLGPYFNYQWSTPDGRFTNTDIPRPATDSPGTYILLVVDNRNGCTAKDTMTVDQNITPPIADAGSGGTLTCEKSEIRIGGDATSDGPGFRYDWSTPDGRFATAVDIRQPSVDAPGIYTLLVTDLDNGCKAQDDIVIEEDRTAPAVDPGPSMTLTCDDPQLHLDGSNSDQGPGFTYEWQTPDGNILEDGHTLRPLVDRAGTYELRVTNTANGCSNAATVTVNADFRIPRVLISGPPLLNCERTIVDLDGTASDSGSGFSFFWRDLDGGGTLVNGNTLAPSTSSPGRYELVVIDENNGCRDSATVTVRDSMLHVVADPGTAPLITCSEPSVRLDGNGSTAGINIIYQWSTNGGRIDGPSDQAAITVSAPGAYQLLVRDTFTRCGSVAEVIVDRDTEAPLAEAGPDKRLDCSTTEVVLDGSGAATNGGALRYEWSGPCVLAGAATSAPTVNCGGTYFLMVENTSNGCSALDSVAVFQDADVPSAVISPPDTLTCNPKTITLDATSSPSGNAVVYQWSGPGIVGGESGLEPIVNEAGLYTLSITNVTNNCVGTAMVEVFENTAPPVANAGEDQLIDCMNPVVIVGDPAADPGFSYDWSTTNGVLSAPDNQPTLVVDIPGDYILRVTDPRNGCSAEDRVTVDRDVNTPFANAGPDRVLNCSASLVTLNGSNSTPSPAPHIIYEWTGDCLLTGPENSIVEVDCPGMYYLSITNTDNGCTSVDSVLVRRDDASAPQASLADTAYIDCESGEALLNGSSSTGGFFTWWRNGVLIEQGDQATRVTEPGDYQLIIENPSLGCSDTATVEVLLDCQPEAVILPPDTLTCRRDIVTIDATASSAGSNYRYEWTSNAPGCIIDGADDPRLRVRCAGDFTLIVTNTAVQRSDTAQVRVEADTTSPVAVVALPDTITCEEPSVALDATGSSSGSVFDYYWSDSNDDTISHALTATANHSGAYLFEVVNRDNGCRSVDFAVVTQDGAVPEITFGSDIIPCQQDTFRLEAKVKPAGVNYNYQWTGAGIVADADGAAVLIDRPGDYQLSVLNPDNGCAGQATVRVTEEGCSPCIEIQIPDTIDCVTASVRLEAQFCDDCNGCTIQWSTGSGVIIDGAETLTPLVGAAATYMLRVTNALGFTAERRVTVLVDRQPPEVDAGPDRNLTCASPVLTLEPAAGTILDNYYYEWLDESGSISSVQQPLTVDRPGRYILAVTNEINGCRATDTTDIGKDTIPPVAEAGTNRRLTCEDVLVTLDAAGSSLGATIRYEWSASGSGSILTGANTPNPTVNAAGVYQLTVRELRNGCTATDSVTVGQQDELPLLPDIGDTTLTCDRPALVFDGTVTGAGNYLYEWCRLDGAGNPVDCTILPERTADTPGRYRFKITDAATGCTNSLVIAIDEDRAMPQVEAGGGGTLGCGDDGFPLQGRAGPAGADLSFQWTASGGGFIEGADTLTATAFAPGTYTLTATNRINGCSASDSVTIDRDEAAPQVEIALPPKLTCSHSEVTLAAQASTVSGRIQWEWQTGEGLIISGANTGTPLVGTPGRYEVRVTDPANGCSSIMAVMVEENTMAPVAVIDSSGGLFFSCDSNQVTLDGRPSATVSDAMLLYSWRVLSGNSIIGSPSDAMVAVDQAGLYRLVVTSMENGCRDTLDVLIQQDPDLPVIDIVPPVNITCSRPEVTLDAGASSSGPDFRYTWRDDSGAVLAEVPELSVRKAGTYELLLRNDATGCADSAVVEVSADTLKPVARIAPVESLDCQTERIELDGRPSSSGPDIIYKWATASGNIINGQDRAAAVVGEPGSYTLTVLNRRNGCESTASVTVDQAADPIEEVFVQVVPPSCSGDDTGTIRVDSVHGGAGPFVYALADDLFTTRSAFSGIRPGAYTLRVQDSNGCEREEVVTVPDARALSVDLGADILVDLGESVRLEAVVSGGSFDRLTWSPAEAFSLQGKPVQIVSPFKTTTYSVTVEWQGCRATDFVTVTVRKARHIYMPTAFSPNGDGNNEVFFLQTGPEVREIKSFMIFDRWGNKVYENGPFPPNDPTYGWDGTIDGQPMNAAVFVFFAEVEFVDGWVEMVKGDVALVR